MKKGNPVDFKERVLESKRNLAIQDERVNHTMELALIGSDIKELTQKLDNLISSEDYELLKIRNNKAYIKGKITALQTHKEKLESLVKYREDLVNSKDDVVEVTTMCKVSDKISEIFRKNNITREQQRDYLVQELHFHAEDPKELF